MSWLSSAVHAVQSGDEKLVSEVMSAADRAGRNIGDATRTVVDAVRRNPGLAVGLLTGGLTGGLIGGLVDNGSRKKKPPKVSNGGERGTACGCRDSKGNVVKGKIPYVVSSWFRVAAGALAADTSLGDFFLTANSAFFSSNNSFPVPFYQESWSGIVSAQIPVAETETAAVVSTAYISLFQKTEYARYSIEDLGFSIVKEQPLTTSGTAIGNVQWPDDAEYDWDWVANTFQSAQLRVPKAVTTVNPIDAGTKMPGFIDG